MKEFYFSLASLAFILGLLTGRAHDEPTLFAAVVIYFMLKAIFFTLLDIRKGVIYDDQISGIRHRDP